MADRTNLKTNIKFFVCDECGVTYVRPSTVRVSKTCSKLCRNRRERRLYRATRNEQKRRHRLRHPEQYGWTEAAKAADQRRRARKKTGRQGERILPTEIHQRDGWRCGLCGEPVLPFVKYPHPRSASIDHVVPLAHGGAHSTDNVQTAHLTCNVAKGASLEVAA